MGIFSAGDKAAKPTSGSTIIAAGTCIQGSVELSCNLHVDGEVRGDIHSLGTVSIGKKGLIVGKVISNQLLISGRYDGECDVDYLEITKTGYVDGDIKAKQLVISKGGSFNGRCSDSRVEEPAELAQLHFENQPESVENLEKNKS